MNRRNQLLPILATALILSTGLATAGTDTKGSCKVAAKSCCKKGSKASVKAAKVDAAKSKKVGATKRAPGTASMKVFIDQNTGELRAPTPAEAKALASAEARIDGVDLNESSEGLTVIQHKNGMQSVDLEGRFMSSSVAAIDADGKLVTGCVDSEKERSAFMKRTAAPKPKLDVQ